MTKHITTSQYGGPLTNHMPKPNMQSKTICPNILCYNQILIFSFRVVRLQYGQTYSHYSHNIPNYPNIYFYFNPTAPSQFIMPLLLQFDFTNGTLCRRVPIPVVTFPIQISLLFLIFVVAYLLFAYAATVTAVHMFYVTVSANSLHTPLFGLERIINATPRIYLSYNFLPTIAPSFCRTQYPFLSSCPLCNFSYALFVVVNNQTYISMSNIILYSLFKYQLLPLNFSHSAPSLRSSNAFPFLSAPCFL